MKYEQAEILMTAQDKLMESILLVDDQPANLQLLSQTLEKLECKLLFAKNGESALAIAQKAQPNLILLDVMMPGIDGFEVCRRLKENPETRQIPVIFLSALDETGDKVRGLQLGAVDYVAKPFQPEEVIARVNTHLTIHRLSCEVQKQRDELEHELLVVSHLQQDLLPERLPTIEGIKLAVYYETSRYAGGDYYDIAELPDGRLGILVADAEGHAAPATVMMAMTCAFFRSCVTCLDAPDQLISYLNNNLCKVNRGSFVTAIYAIYDPQSRILKMARAGNPLPILYRPSEKKAVEMSCEGVLIMGLYPYSEVPVSEMALQPGDRVLFYTDGITERFNSKRETYGVNRLLHQFESTDADAPAGILDGIIEDLSRFAELRPADDDMAMLMMVVE